METPIETALKALEQTEVELQAAAALSRLVLDDTQRKYTAGSVPFSAVLEAQKRHSADVQAHAVHAQTLSEAQARAAEEMRVLNVAALSQGIRNASRVAAGLDLEAGEKLMALEAALHAGRNEYAVRHGQTRELRRAARLDFAQLRALQGRPSPLTRKLTQEEQRDYDNELEALGIAENDQPDRMDRAALHTPAQRENIEPQHENRWRNPLAHLRAAVSR